MKKCSKCGVEKELAEFGERKISKDGLRSQCKACEKTYREANKDKRKAYYKTYQEANKDKIKAYQEANRSKRKAQSKAWQEANKDKIRIYKKSWHEANKDKRKAEMKAYGKAWREAKRLERIEQLKKMIEPNTDNQWVYIMQCGIYHKIGISKDPLRRVEEIEKETQAPTKIIYLAKPFHGRTKDCEKIIHHELKCFNVPIPYAGSDTTSREWFFGDLDKMVEVVSIYAEIEEV